MAGSGILTHAITKERLARRGYYDISEAYKSMHSIGLNRRVPNGTHGGVRGRLLNEWAASYSIRESIEMRLVFGCTGENQLCVAG